MFVDFDSGYMSFVLIGNYEIMMVDVEILMVEK